MRVLIITGSPHSQGNLATFAGLAGDELRRLEHDVETVDLYRLEIGPCRSCDACAGAGKCAVGDHFGGLSERLLAADLIVVATPVYWFSVSGVVKNFMDRTQSLWRGHRLEGRALAAIAVQAYAGAAEACALLASFAKYHRMRSLGATVVTTRDRRDLVAGSPKLQAQAREFAEQLHEAQ